MKTRAREYEKQGLTRLEYDNIHRWLRANYRKKGICSSCTKKRRTQYALISGMTYSKNINHFIELCCSCHLKYDYTELRRQAVRITQRGSKRSEAFCHAVSKRNSGVPKTEETKRKIAGTLTGRPSLRKRPIIANKGAISLEFPSITEAANGLGLRVSAIANNLTGRSNSCGGYLFTYKECLTQTQTA